MLSYSICCAAALTIDSCGGEALPALSLSMSSLSSMIARPTWGMAPGCTFSARFKSGPKWSSRLKSLCSNNDITTNRMHPLVKSIAHCEGPTVV